MGIETIHVRPDPERARRWNLRDNYLIPIYVMWTPDVPQREARASLAGVRDTVRASGQNRRVVELGSGRFSPQGNYSSPEWYVQEALRRQSLRRDKGLGTQVVASEIIKLFYEEPWQFKPHWEVFVVNRDLTDTGSNGYLNFVFGATDPRFRASVQSVTRLMAEVRDPNLRESMVRRVLRHEVGHMFGLVSRNFNYEEKLGRHCTSDICTMKQGMSTPEWAALTRSEERSGIHFCRDCQNDLAGYKPHYRPLPQS